MSDEQPSQREELIELLIYAPVGLLYEYRSVLPQLVNRGRSQVQLAKVLGQMAMQNRQQGARQKFDDHLGSAGRRGEGEADESFSDDPLGLLTLAVARGLTEFGATLGLAPPRSEGASQSMARPMRSNAETDSALDTVTSPDVDSDTTPVTETRSVDIPPAGTPSAPVAERPLPIAGYDNLPAREIISLLGDLNAEQRQRIRAHEQANRARKTVLAKLDRLEDT